MEFYLKLASIEDDKKLKGIILFEDFAKEYYADCKAVLTLGVGKDEYYVHSREEFYIYYPKIDDIFEQISSLLPNARICYSTLEDEGSGESDNILKMENDSQIYSCSTLWEDFDICSDEWCQQVKSQMKKEEEEWRQIMEEIDD